MRAAADAIWDEHAAGSEAEAMAHAGAVVIQGWVRRWQASVRGVGFKSGWLAKEGQYNSELKRRWCVLKSGTLRYHLEPGGACRGSIDVRGASIAILQRPEGGEGAFRLEVVPLRSDRGLGLPAVFKSSGAYVFEADSESDGTDWHLALLSAALGVASDRAVSQKNPAASQKCRSSTRNPAS